MLVLTRKKNEAIIVGGVTITVLRINPDGSVRLGCDGPREITILRSEVKKRIEDETDGR